MRLGCGRGDETNAVVIEGVDQVDKPARYVAACRSEDRDAIDQNGMKGMGNVQEVVRPQRLLAQLPEREARHAHGGERHAHRAALDRELARCAWMLAGELVPESVQLGLGMQIGGHEVELSAYQLLKPEILGRQ